VVVGEDDAYGLGHRTIIEPAAPGRTRKTSWIAGRTPAAATAGPGYPGPPSGHRGAMRTPLLTVGLVLAGLLAAADLATPLVSDGEHPPMVIAYLGAALGLATLVAAVPAWRGSRGAGWVVIATRLVSALTALPAFVIPDVPAEAVLAAGIGVAATLVAVGLIVPALVRGATRPVP
jgi:hypothetical protein